jgi:hypothetical protein
MLAIKYLEQYFAYLYLENASYNKYGSVLLNMSYQKMVSNDQYPKTISKATLPWI